jgi:hypothetical protein
VVLVVFRVFFALLFCVQFAQAHGNLSHRHAAGTMRTLSDGSRSLDLMFTLSLVGPRARLLTARFDLNRDGKFSARETDLFAQELKKEMLGGLELRCTPNHIVHGAKVRYKANQKSERAVTVAALITYALPNSCSTLTVSAREQAQRKGLETLKLLLNAYPPLRLNQSSRFQFELKPGDAQHILVSVSQTL